MVLNIYQISLLTIIIAFVFQRLLNSKQQKLFFCLFSGIVLGIVVAFRDPYLVGIDGIRYYNRYSILSDASFSDLIQIRNGSSVLFFALCKIFSSASIPFEWFTFVIAVFNITIFTFFIYKYSSMPLMSIFLYLGLGLYTFAFSGLKQSIANSIILIVFDCLIQKRYKLSIFLLVVATLIHPTSVVFLPILFVDKIPLNSITIFFGSLIMLIVAVFRVQVGKIITTLGDESYIGVYESKGSIGGTAILLFALFLFYIIACKNEFEGNQSTNRIKKYLLFIGVLSIFFQLLSSYAYSFTRLNFYYIEFMTIVVPESLNSNKTKYFFKEYYGVFKIIFCLLLATLMIKLYFGHIENELLLDYTFIWENMIK